jgi:hypothetical protein
MWLQRRSAEEWGKLVRAWERSGRSRAEFAGEHGVSAERLGWWRWRLARDAEAQGAGQRGGAGVKLLRVDVVQPKAAGSSSTSASTGAVWELHTQGGEVLRGFDEASLHVVVEALLGAGE